VNGWSASNGGLTVHTDTGDLHTGHVVLAAGAWMPALTRDVALRLAVERVVQAWFEPVGEAATLGPDSCPITIWEYERSRHFYAFPAMDGAVKAALHHQGEIVDPERVRREVSDGEVQGILEPLRRHIPSAVGRFRRALTCLYTNTPDEDFIIDRHPGNPRVVLVSACSGHGFKFASAIGETVAKMVKSGEPPPVPARFGLSRFVRPAGVREA
jgi:sarcosine oxidase